MAQRPKATLRQEFRKHIACALGVGLGSVFLSGCLTPDFKLDPESSCSSKTIDGDETDVDCGGSCKPCKVGRNCRADIDCENESCVGGKCADPSCLDDKLNQDETDIDCGGVCGATCRIDDRCQENEDCASGACRGGRCVEASCSDGVKNNAETDVDCGGSLCRGTCEVGQLCNTNADCLQPKAGTDMGTAQCLESDEDGEKRCVLVCPVRRGDCDGLAENGCETNTDTSQNHCGACGQACDPANAALAHCEAGLCQIDECQDGFDDCDPDVPGCETDLRNDPDHCGSCEIDCSDRNGQDTCEDGVCGIICDEGYEDCDAKENPGKNGCETNVRTNVNNCNGCGNVCPGEPEEGIFPVCSKGTCDTVDCSMYAGLAACDGDGVCDDSLVSPEHCGGCGLECIVENGTPGCSFEAGVYECTVKECDENYADCDGAPVDCEVDTRTNTRHCGGCAGDGGVDCTTLVEDPSKHVASVACQKSACTITACAPGWADCDAKADNGCEASLSSGGRCGGCLATDKNAGAGKDCRVALPDAPDVACNEGTCEAVCDAGLCATATGVCEIQLGTAEACRACGEVCQAPEGTYPACSSANGCQIIYPVEVVQDKSAYNTSATDAPDLTLSFELGSGPGRGLVILGNSAGSSTLFYGSTEITPFAKEAIPDHSGFVMIAFLNEAALGAPGQKTVTMKSAWGGKALTILELNNVAQGSARATTVTYGVNCRAIITGAPAVSTRGSLVAAALHVQFDGAVSGSPLGGIKESMGQYAPEQLNALHGYRAQVDSTATVGWNVSATCWRYRLLAASFNPRVQ
jgi:hypothetical protein